MGGEKVEEKRLFCFFRSLAGVGFRQFQKREKKGRTRVGKKKKKRREGRGVKEGFGYLSFGLRGEQRGRKKAFCLGDKRER